MFLIVIPTGNCASKKKLYGFPTLSLTIAMADNLKNFSLKVAIGRRSRVNILYLCLNQVYFFRYVIESKSVCSCCMIIEVPSRTWYSTVSKVFIDSNVDILQSLSNSWWKKNECWLKEPIRQFPNYSTNPNRPCAFIIRNFNKLSQIFFIIQTSHSFYLVQ